MSHLKSIKPWKQADRKALRIASERLQSPAQRAEFKRLYLRRSEVIRLMVQTSCPSTKTKNGDKYLEKSYIAGKHRDGLLIRETKILYLD